MICAKCGVEAMMIDNLWYCGGCVRPPNECTCEPVKPSDDSRSGDDMIPPTSVRR